MSIKYLMRLHEVGLCSLLSDKEKIEGVNKVAPTKIIFALTGDKTAKTPHDLDHSQWQRLILITFAKS